MQLKRVLVIDDSVETADGLREVLQLEGYEAHVAYDAKQGLAHVQTAIPDIVICDIGLPEMDGLRLARILRADQRLAGTRLVALTGYGEREDLANAREAGFDAHFTKPIIIDDLIGALSKLTAG